MDLQLEMHIKKISQGANANISLEAAAAGFLFLASHVGVIQNARYNASRCVLQGGSLPQRCAEGGCCPTDRSGIWPAMLHTNLAPAGFVLRVQFGARHERNVSWTVQAGEGECGIGIKCGVRVIQRGEATWAAGTWGRLHLAAQRVAHGKTRLAWAVAGVEGEALVESFAQARGAVAWGSGLLQSPTSQWDNLTVSHI